MRRLNVASGSTPTVRVVVLGESNVGKSALVVRFLTKRFIGEYASGIEITYQHEVNLAGNWIVAEICDALINKNDKSYFKDLTTNRSTEAFLLVYNVCNRSSFDYVCSLAHEIKARCKKTSNGDDIPLLLVGNKTDLDHFRVVKRFEGEAFAKSISHCNFIETSAAESYSEVERAFKLIFYLVRAQMQTTPTSGVSGSRNGRKHSFTQVANKIRDHYRRQHSLHNNTLCSSSMERGISLSRSQSLCSDRNNNIATLEQQYAKHRTRRSAITAIQPNFSTSVYNGKPKLNARCFSLSTLSENPNVENETTSPTNTEPPENLSEGFYRHSKYHTIDSSLSSQYVEGVAWHDKEERLCVTKMSVSSDEALEFSDISTPEEDPFFPEFYEKTPNNKLSNIDYSNEENRKQSSIFSRNSIDKQKRKTSLNKKGLQLPGSVRSDGEWEEKEKNIPDFTPPKSAPIAVTGSNKFRYFPNLPLENQDPQKTIGVALHSSSVPISPLLEGAPRPRIKSPKEEKRSLSNNLLKQFFKGALLGSSINRESNASLNSLGSEKSLSPTMTAVEFASSLTSIHENPDLEDSPDETGPIYFRASTTSLSSVISNEADATTTDLVISSSAPSSPRVKSNYLETKPRRSTFREAVTELIRKRKKSNTNDCLRHTKEHLLEIR